MSVDCKSGLGEPIPAASNPIDPPGHFTSIVEPKDATHSLYRFTSHPARSMLWSGNYMSLVASALLVAMVFAMYACKLKNANKYKSRITSRLLSASRPPDEQDKSRQPSVTPLCEGFETLTSSWTIARPPGDDRGQIERGEKRAYEEATEIQTISPGAAEGVFTNIFGVGEGQQHLAKRARISEWTADPLANLETLLHYAPNTAPSESPLDVAQYPPESRGSASSLPLPRQTPTPRFSVGETPRTHEVLPWSLEARPGTSHSHNLDEDKFVDSVIEELLTSAGPRAEFDPLGALNENVLDTFLSSTSAAGAGQGRPTAAESPSESLAHQDDEYAQVDTSSDNESETYTDDDLTTQYLDDEFLASHPFYKIPVLKEGVKPKPFDWEFAIKLRGCRRGLPGKLAIIRGIFQRKTLSSDDVRLLMEMSSDLLSLATTTMLDPIAKSRCSEAVGPLSRRLLVADALWCACEILGPAMQKEKWWPMIMERMAAAPLYDDYASMMPFEPWMDFTTKALCALSIYKTGERPTARAVVELKTKIFQMPCVHSNFKRSVWDDWRKDIETEQIRWYNSKST